MPATPSAELRLNALGLRFSESETERLYQRWRNDQSAPVVALACLVSIPVWILSPLAGYLWLPNVDWVAVWRIGFLVVIPVLAVSAFVSYRGRVQKRATFAGALALTVAGVSILWIIDVNARAATGLETTGPSSAVTVLMACFALFMRLPPVIALAALFPFMTLAIGIVFRETLLAELPALYAYAYVAILISTYFHVGVISLVTERFLRRAFVTERLLVDRNAALDRSQTLIRRYVPRALANDIISGKLNVGPPERLTVTTLFSDIVDFTALADRVEPEVITQVLSEYMAAMVEIVEKHGGTVNEFMGDGLMALFGAPNPLEPEQQALSATLAATAMQERVPELHTRWNRLGLTTPVATRIGIHTGVASVGSYGSAGRMTVSVVSRPS